MKTELLKIINDRCMFAWHDNEQIEHNVGHIPHKECVDATTNITCCGLYNYTLPKHDLCYQFRHVLFGLEYVTRWIARHDWIAKLNTTKPQTR